MSSFIRFVALYKSPKRRNGFHFFVLSPSLKARRNDKTTNLPRNIKVWLVVVTCSFCLLFVLSTSTRRQNDRTTTQQNEVLRPFRFCRLFVLSRYTSRQNEEMKFHLGVCSFCRLPWGAKRTNEFGRIRLPHKFDRSMTRGKLLDNGWLHLVLRYVQ